MATAETTGSSTLNLSRNVLLSILVALAAIIYLKFNARFDADRGHVLSGLLRDEKNIELSTNATIAVGFGSCLDLKTNAIPMMDVMGILPPIQPKYHENIKSKEDLADMLAFYLVEGAAAERFIPSTLLEELITASKQFPDAIWVAGGNAPVIGNRFILEGFEDVLIGSKASDQLKSYFPDKLQFLDGVVKRDDVHLILEYNVGEQWGNFTVKRANRFIVHSDQHNPYMNSLEDFEDLIKSKQPRLVIASSLQMLDMFPFENNEIRASRMTKLKNLLLNTPKSTLLHFEMASFIENDMMKSVLENVMPYVDSFGMNEQELPNLLNMLKHGNIIEVADSNPRTATVLDGMRELYEYYGTNSHRQVSRIHVHTLAFQAILVKKGSQWKDNRAAAAKSSLVALRHVCNVSDVNITNTKLIMDDSFSLTAGNDNNQRVYFNENSPVSCWEEKDYEICISPVLVCTAVKQTAGGGDNISAAGIMVQI